MRINLPDTWTVRAVAGDVPADVAGRSIPAAVPGCVHLDLLAAGCIPDPYLDENEAAVAWVARVDWRYETTFDWNRENTENAEDCEDRVDQVDLVALGLDTVASVELNGAVLAHTANMHRSYRFPVAGRLRPGRNALAVTFTSALNEAERIDEATEHRPHVNAHPFNALRKMACNFGWDWGPDLVTAGIWRPIFLETWRGARVAAVRPLVGVDATTGRLRAHVDVQRAPGAAQPLSVEVEIDGVRTRSTLGRGTDSAVLEASVPDVRLWWPHGYGDQPLYPVTVGLADSSGELDAWQGRVGFRTAALDTTPDEAGTPFTILINGTRVFARGVNWIPDDAFPSRITAARYAQRLSQARDANVNLIRVWGGGIYESEDFYDRCDELGLLVWQDFLLACAAYAEEEPLRGEIVAEAREAITRLSGHASLILWNGGNENIWGHEDWGWKDRLDGRTWGWGYYGDILPSLVAELDPTRPYSPGSPYSISPQLHPNDPAHGTMHIWDVWNQIDYTGYRAYRPRFVSEFGFQGPPTWPTLTRSIHDQPLSPESVGMVAHQKAEGGHAKLVGGLDGHLPVPDSFADWHWATSLNQARAIAFGVEHFRSWTPTCMGAVLWQLNDCWPVTSWAAIDGDGRLKPLWYALRRSLRDRLLTVQPRDGGLALVAVNDSAQPWRATVEVTRRSLDGEIRASVTVPLDLGPRGATTTALPFDVAQSPDPANELILAEDGHDRAWWPFAEDVDASLSDPGLGTRLDRVEGGYRLSVTTRRLVRDLTLLAERLAPDAVVDEMLVTLLPGETASFTIRTGAELREDELVDPLVLRSANQLAVRAGQPGGAG